MKIYGLIDDSYVDGPGMRFVCFTQGCPHNCPGCHNPDSHDPTGGHEISTAELKELFRHSFSNDLTFSGGEPFCQPEECLDLARYVHQLNGNVWCYTGWTFEHLRDHGTPAQKALLHEIDVLVDGPFVEQLKNMDLYCRGSANQRLIRVKESMEAGKIVFYKPFTAFDSIAIDGPAGAGKTTQAKILAKKLGFLYVNTGAMYRTVALSILRHGMELEDVTSEVLGRMHIEAVNKDGMQHMMLDSEDVTYQISTPEVAAMASACSALPAVREYLLFMQREFASHANVVMEGRDIGTVVIPDATCKIFLTADAEERAKRRMREYEQKGQDCSYESVLESIRQRDHNDSTRPIAPLKQADDAVYLDGTDLSVAETTKAILQAYNKAQGDKARN